MAEILIKHWCSYHNDILLHVVFVHLNNSIVNLIVKLTILSLSFSNSDLPFKYINKHYNNKNLK